MITINGYEKEYVLDLNKHPENIHNLNVESCDGNNKLHWHVYIINNKGVNAIRTGDILNIQTDFKTLKQAAVIVIRNTNKETFKIHIIPNIEATMEKVYEFCVDNERIIDGVLSFDIISRRNDKDFPWKCVYFGGPLSYDIDKPEYSGSTNVVVKLKSKMFSQYPTRLTFKQKESGNEIKLSLLNDKEGIVKVD